MRFVEFQPQQQLDEALPKWAAGAAAAGALALSPSSTQINTMTPTHHVSAAQHVLSDADVLAQTIWAEARNQGIEGMTAVGNVIMNRVKDTKHARMFGDSIKNIVLKNKQFSCWNHKDPNYVYAKKMRKIDHIIRTKRAPEHKTFEDWSKEFQQSNEYQDYKLWRAANKLAHSLLSGQHKDTTHGATYYHTTAVHPVWTKSLHKIGKVGMHIFYRIPTQADIAKEKAEAQAAAKKHHAAPVKPHHK